MSRPPAPAGPIYSTQFKIVAAVVVVVATGLLSFAYLLATEDDEPGSGSGATSEFVEALLPPENSQVVQQSTVGIDLEPGWQGVLRLGGQDIPEDQLAVSASLNQVTFTPGPGQVLESLTPGRLCAQALVWRSASGRGNGERTVHWCFEVI
ncbi:MAG: hypothetical protein ACRD2C_16810 [Acidimicrobiales bacterium]